MDARGASLSDDLVRELLAEQFPQLTLDRIEFIGEGEGRTYLIDREYIFRFPRDERGEAKMRREICLLSAIRDDLPIPVPAFEFVGQPSERYPYLFAGHHEIAGRSGEELRPERPHWSAIARQLGEFLSVLHATPTSIGRRCGLPLEPMQAPEPLLKSTLRYADVIRREIPDYVDERVERYLSGDVPVPPASPPTPYVCHADIKGEHIIVSEAGDAVAGVIDWTDSCLTDRLLDFTGLMIWLGEEFVRQVLAHYTVPVDEHFFDRVRFYARCFALGNLGKRLRGEEDAPLDLLLRQARWAFAG